jgi:hypothetical protein
MLRLPIMGYGTSKYKYVFFPGDVTLLTGAF